MRGIPGWFIPVSGRKIRSSHKGLFMVIRCRVLDDCIDLQRRTLFLGRATMRESSENSSGKSMSLVKRC
jgi:hypothetical protein